MARPALKLADDTTRKPTKRQALNKTIIDAIRPPAEGRSYTYDRTAGLCLITTAAGHKSFCWYRKLRDGRIRKLVIGTWPEVSVGDARDAADQFNAQRSKGEDPGAERRVARQAAADVATVQGAWDRYRAHLEKHKSPKSARNDSYLFNALPFKHHRLDSVTLEDVKQLHGKLSESGPVWATRVCQFLRRLFNYATDELGYTGMNPVRLRRAGQDERWTDRRIKCVKIPREESRDRRIEAREMPAFLKALDTDPDHDFKHLIHLLLYTAQRRGAVQSMRWADLDLERGTWSIPAEAMKQGKAVRVPLIRRAVAVLRLRRKWNRRRETPSEWVFPSKRGKLKHMTEPKKNWWALRKRAGIPDVTLHDLRRTTASWAADAGVSDRIIKAMLAHKVDRFKDVTGVYSRPSLDAIADALTRTIDAMREVKK
jgi:integrase